MTSDQIALIKQTIPHLEQQGEQICTLFYRQLIRDNPELTEMFGVQQIAQGVPARKLANALLMYAKHLEDLESMQPLLQHIASRHNKIKIDQAFYPIVGIYLVEAIKQVLGGEIATPAIVNAWRMAYKELAAVLINTEQALKT